MEWGDGIYFNKVRNGIITNSFIGYNTRGITLDNSHNNVLSDNQIAPNYFYGIQLSSSNDNMVTRNLVTQDYFYYDGIILNSANDNVLTYNTISYFRRYGLYLSSSVGNQIYHNNFINNAIQAAVFDGSDNIFNLPSPDGGNYWSNYDTPTEGCNNLNGDNFCDTPYVFTGGQDNLPWTKQDGWLIFSSFSTKVEAEISTEQTENELEARGSFVLGPGSNGFSPTAEKVKMGFSNVFFEIPEGSFQWFEHPKKPEKNEWRYEGVIDDTPLEMKIRPLGNNSYEFKFEAKGLNLCWLTSPLEVTLQIGDDIGKVNAIPEVESWQNGCPNIPPPTPGGRPPEGFL